MNRRVRFVALQTARVCVLMAVVFSAPALFLYVIRESVSRRYASASLAYAVHTALLYPAGMFVGHLKRDGAKDFGFGGSYLWFLGGGFYLLLQMVTGPFTAREGLIGALLIAGGVPPFVVGMLGVKRTRELQSRRRAAGQCIGCGYDLAGLRNAERCPECGTPLRDARQTAAAGGV